jgi:phosphoribosylglycinamide formyltransferase-1
MCVFACVCSGFPESSIYKIRADISLLMAHYQGAFGQMCLAILRALSCPSVTAERLPIAVLASGGGTNLQALLDSVHGHEAEVVAVASGSPGARAFERAAARGVPTKLFLRAEYADRGARDQAMADWLVQRGARLIVLAGYMELLSPAFLRRFPGAVINVHPSLLPAFPGLHAIEQALAYGVKVFGVTVHFVDEGCDTGPVICQQAVELPDARDAEEVLAALHPLEHALLPEAVRLFARGALRADPENERRVVCAP